MKTQRYITHSIVVLFLFLAGIDPVFSQQGKNINFLRVVPQSGYTNPAIVAPYNFYIGFPGLSSLKVEMKNTPFDFDDIVKTNANDSLYLDTQAFLNSLKTKNYLMAEVTNEFLAFGVRINQAFISFNLSEKFTGDVMYPKESISFLVNGNSQYLGSTVNAGGFDINVTQYHELALGLSYTFNKKISAGFRAKYLLGVFNIETKHTDIDIYSPDEFTMVISTDLEINSTIPGNDVSGDDSLGFNINGNDFFKGLYSFKNSGLGLDLGVQYMPTEKFTFGLSVTDLGYINWKTDVRNIVSNEETSSHTFTGIDISAMFSSDSVKFTDQLNNALDSLKEDLGIRVTYNKYKSWLVTKFYLSGIFHLTPKDHFGFLWRGDLFKGHLMPSVTLNYTREFGKAFSMMAGYTIAKDSYTNFGLGFAVNAGPVQLYLMTDNLLGVVQITNTRYANTHFGINLVFGRSKWYNNAQPEVKPPEEEAPTTL